MPDYLAIATACSDDMERPACDLLGLFGVALARFMDSMRLGACMDLQVAIDNAIDAGQVGLAGQLPLFRMAA